MDFGRESGDQATADKIIFDYREAGLDPADRALCDFAAKLTIRPGSMGPADVERLRGAGFDDAAVTIAVQVVAYFNYINRIADGLGVDDESWMTLPRDEWHARKGRDFDPPAP